MKHILIIRLSAMGDVAMTVPTIRALVQQNKPIKITLLTREFFTPFFEEFDNLTVFAPDLQNKHKGFFGLVRLFKELKALKIDEIADLHNVLRSKIIVKLFQFSGVKAVQIDKGRKEKKAITKSFFGKKRIPLKSTHERYADVFRKLGFQLNLSTVNFPLKKTLLPLTSNKFNNKLLVGFAPFATYESKSLPLKQIKKIVEALSKNTELTILLFGGGIKEKLILEELALAYDNVISMVQQHSFKEELSIISNLKVMISMDSGNGHLAAMYGVPVITIWGLTHPCLGFTPFHQPEKNQILPDLNRFPLIPTSVYGNKYPKEYLDCFETLDLNKIIDIVTENL